jgi:ABC-type branched-subunit amino acid transport system ATPase component
VRDISASNGPADHLLAAEKLQVRYGATQVLWGISFNVARGKLRALSGQTAREKRQR